MEKFCKKSSVSDVGKLRSKTSNGNAASNFTEFDIMLSEDGSLVKKQTGNSKRTSENSASIAEQHQLIGQINKNRRMDLQDKMDFGPVHRCCQIFNVLVRSI